MVRELGSIKLDLTPIGRKETIMAWYFHLQTLQPTPDYWQHYEDDPSNGGDPIEFKLYWVNIDQLPTLGEFDAMKLSAVRSAMLRP